MELTIDLRTEGNWTIVAVGGEIDLLTAPSVRERLMAAIEDGATQLLLDMSEVSFLDSSGLGVIVAAHKRLRERDGRLVIVATARAVLSVLSLTGLDRVFEVASSVEDVLGAART